MRAQDLKDVRVALAVYRSDRSQLIVLQKPTQSGGRALAVVPVASLAQDLSTGLVTFEVLSWREGLPLGLFEDPNVAVDPMLRATWLSSFHEEREWLDAVHRSTLGLAIPGLSELFGMDYADDFERAMAGETTRELRLARRFELRRRQSMETDLFLHASPYWYFSAKDFNAGGNHGGFTRQSMHAVFWLLGGRSTRVATGPLVINRAYDGLDFAPTVLEAAGVTTNGQLPATNRSPAFLPFPGRVAVEALASRP